MEGDYRQNECWNFAFQVLDFVVCSVLCDINEFNFDIKE